MLCYVSLVVLLCFVMLCYVFPTRNVMLRYITLSFPTTRVRKSSHSRLFASPSLFFLQVPPPGFSHPSLSTLPSQPLGLTHKKHHLVNGTTARVTLIYDSPSHPHTDHPFPPPP